MKKGLVFYLLAFALPCIGQEAVHHYGFSLLYSEQHEQAAWVSYTFTKDEAMARVPRSDNFRPDPMVETGTANDADYKGSGYDRGHLAPAADMAWSQTSMSESFYYSNMSPQNPSFNRGVWKRLEEQVRSWAVVYDSVHVVTGPVLRDHLPQIGVNGVSVPEYYYKVILDNRAERQQAIGFVMRNESSSMSIGRFAVSIDSVEQLTGIDFFSHLNDSLEDRLERNMCYACWDWNIRKTSTKRPTQSASVQCIGKTQEGLRCRISTKNENAFCHVHQAQAPSDSAASEKRSTTVRCTGTTKAGIQCKRMTYSTNSRCFQHGGD